MGAWGSGPELEAHLCLPVAQPGLLLAHADGTNQVGLFPISHNGYLRVFISVVQLRLQKPGWGLYPRTLLSALCPWGRPGLRVMSYLDPAGSPNHLG